MKLVLSLALVCVLLAGCGRHVGRSFTGTVPDAALPGIAWDATERLASLYPPGHTSVYLAHPDGSGKPGKFGSVLEQSLRAQGFKIAPLPGSSPKVSWTVDALGDTDPPSSWYLRLTVSDSDGLRTFGRVYDGQGRAQGSFTEGKME